MKHQAANHNPQLPTARKIRRSCQAELYRTIKRLKVYILPEKVEQAETIYFKKVANHAVWLHENRSNRKKQVDWWEENVCDELVAVLEVDREEFVTAFRAAYGG
ncbi:MAG TPA: dehydrogenase [Candidatus Paenibacillus intestinavium]|nr:dehydrogenase [Candidatus Paenibacillus intestinavium]